jgi:hypothetical protein
MVGAAPRFFFSTNQRQTPVWRPPSLGLAASAAAGGAAAAAGGAAAAAVAASASWASAFLRARVRWFGILAGGVARGFGGLSKLAQRATGSP